MRVVLASTSRYRRELVGRLRVAIDCVASPYDEEAGKRAHAGADIPSLAKALALAKARAVAAMEPDAVVIGSDQIAELDGARLDKPGTAEAACAQLARLAGREHRLHTALALVHGATGREEVALDTHVLAMRALTAEEIARYVALDAPMDCAGSYRVESLGVALFERITGDDFTAVIGMPLTRTVTMLAGFGVHVLRG